MYTDKRTGNVHLESGYDSFYEKLMKMPEAVPKRECDFKEESTMKVKEGDYVVYVKDGNLNTLGQHKRDIWIVRDLGTWNTEVSLRSIRDKNKTFETDSSNVVSLDTVKAQNLFKEKNFITEAWNKYNNTDSNQYFTESKTMNNNAVSRTMDANVDAAKVAATITAGNTLNKVVARQLVDRKVLPILVRGYADTAFGAVIIANIADFAVKQFNVKNPKARLATEAMMQAAMVDLLAEVDFEGIINDVLANVDLGDAEATS